MFADKFPNAIGQIVFLGDLIAFSHMADDYIRASIRIIQRIVRIMNVLLVFGEEKRVAHFTDVMVERGHMRHLRIGADRFRRLLRQSWLLASECWYVPGASRSKRCKSGLLGWLKIHQFEGRRQVQDHGKRIHDAEGSRRHDQDATEESLRQAGGIASIKADLQRKNRHHRRIRQADE